MDSRFAFAHLGGAVLLLASLGQPVMAQSIWPEATAKFESSSSAGSGSRRSRTAREARSRARPRSGDATDKGPRVGVTGDFLWNAPEAGQRESGRLKARKKPAPGAERLVGRTFSPAGSGEWQWKITRTEWTEQDETAFGEFIRKIGESDCRTTHECLTSPAANPAYHATNPPGMKFFADCADLPFMLRGYFAWKNGLPFSYSTAISFHPDAQGRPSSAHGFQITGRDRTRASHCR